MLTIHQASKSTCLLPDVLEEVLTKLEGEWEHVRLQLPWKLEPCFMRKQEFLTEEAHVGDNIDLTLPTSPVIVSSPIVCADSEVQAPVNSPDIQTPVIYHVPQNVLLILPFLDLLLSPLMMLLSHPLALPDNQ